MVFELLDWPHWDWIVLGMGVTHLVLAWGLFKYKLLDVMPVARDALLESMNDAVIALDTQNRLVDLNPAARQLVGELEGVGQVLTAVFPPTATWLPEATVK